MEQMTQADADGGITAGDRDGKHAAPTQVVIGIFYDVYNELGFGFLESVYKEALRVAMTQAGLDVQAEIPISVYFRGSVVGTFRMDLVVDQKVLIEIKTCEQLSRAHESQTMNYLRSTSIEVALLFNFGPTPKVRRLVLDNARKKISPSSI